MGIPKIRTVDVDVGEIYVFQPGPVEVPGPATLAEPATDPTRCAPNVHRIRELRLITAAQKLLRALLRHLGGPQVRAGSARLGRVWAVGRALHSPEPLPTAFPRAAFALRLAPPPYEGDPPGPPGGFHSASTTGGGRRGTP